MTKIAHIADTHIRNLKFHYEYKIIFTQIYETLKNEKVDYIVHCGDIAHTKTQISPEFVEMRKHFPKWLMIKSVMLVECRSHKATDGRLIVLRNKYNPSADAIVNLKLPCPMAPSWGIEYFKTVYPQFAHINGG